MNFVTTICATPKYTYALDASFRRIQAAANHAEIKHGHLILVGDESDCLEGYNTKFKALMPNWSSEVIKLPVEDGHTNYQESAQLTIAVLRSYAYSKARTVDADYCFSIDSDVLIPYNAFQCALDAVNFDRGQLYSVSTCPYPSQGGGGWLFGRGTPIRPISPDVYPEERKLPKELRKRLAKALKEGKMTKELDAEIEKCTPYGNVYVLNGQYGWKKRGWGAAAYPEIGWGAIVPTDWCGMGATLMTKKALNLAIFDGYALKGTEDLHLCWKRWFGAGIKIAAVPHCLSDHIIRDKVDKTKLIQCRPYHEWREPYEHHLRLEFTPFYNFVGTDRFDAKNDGKPTRPQEFKKDEKAVA